MAPGKRVACVGAHHPHAAIIFSAVGRAAGSLRGVILEVDLGVCGSLFGLVFLPSCANVNSSGPRGKFWGARPEIPPPGVQGGYM